MTHSDPTQTAECARPRRGPLYWDWRCLNCDRPVSAHRSRLRRIVFDNSVWGFWRRHNDGCPNPKEEA